MEDLLEMKPLAGLDSMLKRQERRGSRGHLVMLPENHFMISRKTLSTSMSLRWNLPWLQLNRQMSTSRDTIQSKTLPTDARSFLPVGMFKHDGDFAFSSNLRSVTNTAPQGTTEDLSIPINLRRNPTQRLESSFRDPSTIPASSKPTRP